MLSLWFVCMFRRFMRRRLTGTLLLRRSFRCLGPCSVGYDFLPLARTDLLMMFAFALRFWRGEEASEDLVEERPVLFFFHQAGRQGFSEQVTLDTDCGHSLHSIHALTPRDT